jgi:outer membrane protein assembly factor BamB
MSGRRLAAVVWLSLACGALVGESRGEDWPQWRGPRADSTWEAPVLPDKWPDGGLVTAWQQPVGGGYGGIAVADGRVFLMDRQKEPAEVERVLCFHAETGKPLWTVSYPVQYGKLDYGNGPRATPTVHEGRVYAFGALGHLHCLEAATGKILWSKDPTRDYVAKLPEWGLAASPLIWEDLVIVHPGAQPGGCYIAFDRLSGAEVWRSSDDPAGYATPIAIDSPSGPQLICWTPLHILGVAPRTGKVLWSVPYKVTYGVSIATPLYREGIVCVSGYWEGAKAIRLGSAPVDAELIWEDARNLRGLMSPPLYREGIVYQLDKQYGLTAFELATGKKLWDDDNQLTPRGRNPQANLVWLANEPGRVLALNSEGDLILARLSPEGYTEQSRTNIIGPTWAHPGYAGSRVYVRTDTELKCVELLPKSSRADNVK